MKYARKSTWFTLVFRCIQIIAGLAVIGMFAPDLNAANKLDIYIDGKWVRTADPKTSALVTLPPEMFSLLRACKVFATFVGSASAVFAFTLSIINIFSGMRNMVRLFIVEILTTLLFAVCVGIFATMYAQEQIEMEAGVHRMKVALVFMYVGLAAWTLTAGYSFQNHYRESKSRQTRVEIPDTQWQGDGHIPKPARSFGGSTLSRGTLRG